MGGRGAFGLDGRKDNGRTNGASDEQPVSRSNNEFKEFKTYQGAFANVTSAEQLRNLLNNNGITLGDKFVRDIKNGKIPLGIAKEFVKGSLLTISHQGDGRSFIGFDTVGMDNGVVAYYKPNSGNSVIYLNRREIAYLSSGKNARGIGAHEAMHNTTYILGDKNKFGYYGRTGKYSQNIVEKSLQQLKKIEPKSRQMSNASYAEHKIKNISSYAWTGGNTETISEAMNNVMRKGARADNLSKIIYKNVRNDARKARKKK